MILIWAYAKMIVLVGVAILILINMAWPSKPLLIVSCIIIAILLTTVDSFLIL